MMDFTFDPLTKQNLIETYLRGREFGVQTYDLNRHICAIQYLPKTQSSNRERIYFLILLATASHSNYAAVETTSKLYG